MLFYIGLNIWQMFNSQILLINIFLLNLPSQIFVKLFLDLDSYIMVTINYFFKLWNFQHATYDLNSIK